MSEELEITQRDGICTVTLNRPESLNAASPSMLFALTELTGSLAENESAQVVILTGAGRAFSAGGDFQHLVKTSCEPEYARATLENSRRFIEGMLALPMPVIAAVNGPAVGFGATMLALSDLVLISDRAYIAEPHINVGLVLGDGISVTWPLMMSLLRAKEFIYTGDKITPDQAVLLGLANRVVEHDQLMPEALTLALKLCRQPRTALRESKKILNGYIRRNIESVLNTVLERQYAQTQGPEHGAIVEGLIANQKRRQAEAKP